VAVEPRAFVSFRDPWELVRGLEAELVNQTN
jgi:hypothetical protein